MLALLRWLRHRPSAARQPFPLQVESLETRNLPTIVFTPQFGPDVLQSRPPFNAVDSGVMSSATVYLILWGPAWSQTPTANQVDANTIVNETKTILNSGALSVLKEYGSDGLATFGGFAIDNSTPPADFAVASGSGLAGSSYFEAEDEITSVINSGLLPGPAGNPAVAAAPIYAIVTDPADSFDGDGNVSNGGVNRNGNITNGTFDGANINMIGVGTGGDPTFIAYGPIFSHELLEKMSEPEGRPDNAPPAGYGVVVSPPTAIPPYIKDAPTDPVAAQDNWDQIGDFEPEQGFRLANGNSGFAYVYRVGGPGGVEVQAVFSAARQAFVVADGNAAVFTLTPNWTIDRKDANNDVFDGTFDLTVNGDQLANADDNITISQDAAGGIQVDLDGQIAYFDPATADTIGTAIRSITVNGRTSSTTLTLDLSRGNFLSVMNPNDARLAGGLITFNGGSGSSNHLIINDAPGSFDTWSIRNPNAGTIAIGAAQVSFSGVQNLTGGAENDVFRFVGGTVRGAIDGGEGANWLDYSARPSRVTVNLATGTASAVLGGVAHIDNVIGGARGGSTLVGSAAGGVLVGRQGGNSITAGAGRSIIIGGFGANRLTGGPADDLIIDGRTAYDGTVIALQSISATWQSAPTYSQRIAALQAPGADRLQAGTTVFVFSGIDGIFGRGASSRSIVHGSAGLNWFIASAALIALDRQPGEVVTMG